MNKFNALIIMILFVLLSVAGIKGAGAEIITHDAEGNQLGIYLGNSSNNIVQIHVPSLERDVHINISSGDLTGRDIYFGSYDCSGIAHVVAEGAYKIILNGDLYYAGEKAAPTQLSVHSVFRSYNASCEAFNSTRFVVPADTVELPFVLPVALPLSLEVEKKYKD